MHINTCLPQCNVNILKYVNVNHIVLSHTLKAGSRDDAFAIQKNLFRTPGTIDAGLQEHTHILIDNAILGRDMDAYATF